MSNAHLFHFGAHAPSTCFKFSTRSVGPLCRWRHWRHDKRQWTWNLCRLHEVKWEKSREKWMDWKRQRQNEKTPNQISTPNSNGMESKRSEENEKEDKNRNQRIANDDGEKAEEWTYVLAILCSSSILWRISSSSSLHSTSNLMRTGPRKERFFVCSEFHVENETTTKLCLCIPIERKKKKNNKYNDRTKERRWMIGKRTQQRKIEMFVVCTHTHTQSIRTQQTTDHWICWISISFEFLFHFIFFLIVVYPVLLFRPKWWAHKAYSPILYPFILLIILNPYFPLSRHLQRTMGNCPVLNISHTWVCVCVCVCHLKANAFSFNCILCIQKYTLTLNVSKRAHSHRNREQHQL